MELQQCISSKVLIHNCTCCQIRFKGTNWRLGVYFPHSLCTEFGNKYNYVLERTSLVSSFGINRCTIHNKGTGKICTAGADGLTVSSIYSDRYLSYEFSTLFSTFIHEECGGEQVRSFSIIFLIRGGCIPSVRRAR